MKGNKKAVIITTEDRVHLNHLDHLARHRTILSLPTASIFIDLYMLQSKLFNFTLISDLSALYCCVFVLCLYGKRSMLWWRLQLYFTVMYISIVWLWFVNLLLWSPYVIGQTVIFLPCGFFLSSSFFSSPNLSGRRLDVYHTSTHGMALVQI